MQISLHGETRRFLANLRLSLFLITPLFLVLTWSFWGIFLGIVLEDDSWVPPSLLRLLLINGVLIAGFLFPMPLMLPVMQVVTYRFSKRWGSFLALLLFLVLLALVVTIADWMYYHPDSYPPEPTPHWIVLMITDFFDRAPEMVNWLSLSIASIWTFRLVFIPQSISLVVFAWFFRLPARSPSNAHGAVRGLVEPRRVAMSKTLISILIVEAMLGVVLVLFLLT